MVYLFIGQDSSAKEAKLKKLKEEFLQPETEEFNLERLYARELSLRLFQETVLRLPVKSKKRIILIKEAGSLKEDIRQFILNYIKKLHSLVVLVLDFERYDKKDEFIHRLSRTARVFRFRETIPLNTFSLSQQIKLRKPDYALKILHQLLQDGEKPERILGGLRYALSREITHPQEIKKRLKLLLHCDIEIKTGRLKSDFALEKLAVNLCLLK